MSNPSTCGCGAASPSTVSIPGLQGLNSFTFTTAQFVVPLAGEQVQISVQSSEFAVIGQSLYIEGAGLFEVISRPSPTLLLLSYFDVLSNTESGSAVAEGSQVGPGGIPGLDGINGGNAYTTTTASFEVPTIGNTVSIAVADSSFLSVGQNVYVGGAGVFEVTVKSDATHFTGEYLDYVGNSHATDTIASGAGVSPAGTQPDVSGLGQAITQVSDDAIGYDITNAYDLITGITLTVPADKSGLYKVESGVTVRYTGVTFATSRILSMRVQNTTLPDTISETTRETGVQTTTTFPDIDYVLPTVSVDLTEGDVLELQCFLDTVESAGDATVEAASLSITPLSLT